MKKVGILGGTFNPIHIGHLMLAEQAADEYGLEKVLILPSGVSYMKSNLSMPPGAVRGQMAELAVIDNPRLAFCDIELVRKGNTYTCDTCDELKMRYPDCDFFFIIGSDTLYSMEQWKDIDHVFASFHILAALRNDASEEALLEKAEELKIRYNADIRVLHTPIIEIASNEIRQRYAQGKSIRYYVPDKVYHFIKERDLYHEDND